MNFLTSKLTTVAAAVVLGIAIPASAMAQNQRVAVPKANAGGQPSPDMLGTLKTKYPGTTFRQVTTTSVDGIYEVVMGQNVAYVDRTGRYFFFGRLFDMQTQKDLTAEKADTASRIDMSVLNTADAIKIVKGNGTRVLHVFSDPDCPFCKQLEQNLVGLNDVTIYTYLFPLEGLHPEARAKADAVWCSQDRAKAWEGLMMQGTVPTGVQKCETPVSRNIALAEKLGITGTPTLISGDGRKMAGARSADQLSSWLNAGLDTKAAQAPGQNATK